jgi:hypothetical protein
MKRHLLSVAFGFGIAAAMYLMFVIIEWNWDLYRWQVTARAIAIIMGVLTAVSAGVNFYKDGK